MTKLRLDSKTLQLVHDDVLPELSSALKSIDAYTRNPAMQLEDGTLSVFGMNVGVELRTGVTGDATWAALDWMRTHIDTELRDAGIQILTGRHADDLVLLVLPEKLMGLAGCSRPSFRNAVSLFLEVNLRVAAEISRRARLTDASTIEVVLRIPAGEYNRVLNTEVRKYMKC